MIRVALHRSRVRPGFRGYTVEGHAESAPEGEPDLVCAAVSVLTDTTANALERVARIRPVVAESDGSLACFLPPETGEEAWQTAQIILRTMESGLCDIAAQYPRYVRIECE